MVSISQETPDETARRLLEVLRRADLQVLPGAWTFLECPRHWWRRPNRDALAVVFDEHVASELVPWAAVAPDRAPERFGVFSFHFADAPENSGFVGWLANELKGSLGTGVAVICGYNSRRGGVFDYWAVPHELLEAALDVVAGLQSRPAGAGG